MPFALDAIIGDTTYSLTDGNPYSLESADGLGAPDLRRLSERGPLQNGVSDTGYRLAPRIMTLSILFTASSASVLDARRSTLASIFRPHESTPITLQVTRDDGETRSITCYAVGQNEIPVERLHRPGNLHRVVVQLRADNPLWRGATTRSSSSKGPGDGADWWLAGGAIGSANVMEIVELPAQGQAWTYTGNLVNAPWSVAFSTTYVAGAGTQTAFQVGTAVVSPARFSWNSATSQWRVNSGVTSQTIVLGTSSHVITYNSSGPNSVWYQNGTVMATNTTNGFINFPDRAWRAVPGGGTETYWPVDLPRAAVYNTDLSQSQVTALHEYLIGDPFSLTVSVAVDGDLPTRPQFELLGPMSAPRIRNATTNREIRLTGVTIPAGSALTLDLQQGVVTLYDAAGTNQLGAVTDPITMLRFDLQPASVVAGGTNQLICYAGSMDTNAQFHVSFTDKYLSF